MSHTINPYLELTLKLISEPTISSSYSGNNLVAAALTAHYGSTQ